MIYDVFKAWKEACWEKNGRELTAKWSGTALSILAKPIESRPDFDFEAEEMKSHLKKNKVKYNSNPPNWGPGNKAVSNTKKASKKAKEKQAEEEQEEKGE